MPQIAATAVGFPRNYYSQEVLLNSLAQKWSSKEVNIKLLERFHHNVNVDGRHLALPIQEYERLDGFESRNNVWTETALDLGEEVICELLAKSGLKPQEVDHLLFTTVTGVAVPSIDARLMNRIHFSKDLKRTPLFGLGCVGGAAGIARAADYLIGHPQEAVILLSVELCSLTVQLDDFSIENLIASGLFGDGAAAVLLVGDEHRLAKPGQARVIDSQSIFFPDSEHIMGWDVRDSGFKIVLSPEVVEVAKDHLKPAMEEFLHKHDLVIDDIGCWLAHPGGPKVIEALEAGLGLGTRSLQVSRDTLERVGNISSTSVLIVLQETMARGIPDPGTYGLMLAMGPAFCAELVLLQW